MTDTSDVSARRIVDKLAPDPQWGAVRGFLSTTYDLGPDFFEMDFLPALLGLGTWDDRRWASRIALEKHLFQLDTAAVIADARRYHGRPRSLRLEVVPGVAPRGSSLHAKFTLVLFERAVRLIVGSANLTERGYRRNREVVAILTATASSKKEAGLISSALHGAGAALDQWLTAGARKLVLDALDTLQQWTNGTSDPQTSFLWTHGQTKLWREYLSRWPADEKVRRLSIISPFWSENAGLTLSALLKELKRSNSLAADAEVRLLTDAFEGPDGQILPILPLGYASYDWEALGAKATAQAVSPKVLPSELGGIEGFSGSRVLHAKVVVMEGSKIAVAYLGSANFTAHGWGFLDSQTAANVEAGMILRRTIQSGAICSLIPELAGKPVLLSHGAFHSLRAPEQGPDDAPWPEFIHNVLLCPVERDDDELELLIQVHPDRTPFPWAATLLDKEGLPGEMLISVDSANDDSRSSIRVALSSATLSRLLTDQEVQIRWAACPGGRPVPLNVDASARHRLPISPAHQRIQEADLLFYYQGRISWEDLFPDPDPPSEPSDSVALAAAPEAGVDKSRIQSYQVREFVEALTGISSDLAASTQSESSMRLALLGPVSPLALANSIRDAVDTGCRTPMAAAFQLVEILGCLKLAESFPVPDRLATAWDANLREAANKITHQLKQLTNAHPAVFGGRAFSRYKTSVLANGKRGEE